MHINLINAHYEEVYYTPFITEVFNLINLIKYSKKLLA